MIISFCNLSFATDYSLYKTLDFYGFPDNAQKEALENLMRYASILPENQTINDLYPPRNTEVELLKDILSFVKQLQKHFVIRSGNQERWEVKANTWTQENKENIIANARTLGFIEKISPKQKQTDAICILGSTLESMQKRIKDQNEKKLAEIKVLLSTILEI